MNKKLYISWVAVLALMLLSAGSRSEPILNGLATHAEFGKEKFIAGLYVETPSDNANSIMQSAEPKRLEVRITGSSYSSRRFKKLWIEGMAINSNSTILTQQADNMVAFSKMVRHTLRAGDQFSINFTPDEGSEIILNGQSLGNIKDAGFFQLLLRTWIGPVPLSSSFRAGLLTSGDTNEDLLSRYIAATPTQERRDAVAALVAGTASQVAGSAQASATKAAATATKVVAAAPRIVPPSPTKQRSTKSAPSKAAKAVAKASQPAPQPAAAPTTTPAQTATKARPTPTKSAPTPAPTPAQVAKAPTSKAAPSKASPSKATPTKAPSLLTTASLDDEESALFDEAELEDAEEELLTAESLLSRQLYISKLLKWTYKYIKYPARAIKRNQQGSVRLSVTIGRDGKLKNVATVEKSKYAMLTRAATDAVEKASPYPPMPDEVKGDEFEFSLPIAFRLPD